MTAPYRIYGAETSPYSLKVRSFMRFKGIDHEWLSRSAARAAEFARYAKLPLIPVVVGADDYSMQDSTPILDKMEQRYPEPTTTPAAPALRFLSWLIEDYADEWLNKAMFHYRWSYEPDALTAAQRIAAMMLEGMEGGDQDQVAAQIRERMGPRLSLVGSSADTAPIIEASYHRLLECLEPHLAARPYLFGARPAIGDFGLAAQLQQLAEDPTPGAILRERAPAVAAYVARMAAPSVEGEFEPLEALQPTLRPLLTREIAGAYLPFMAANAEAARGQEEAGVAVEIHGALWRQAPQRYAAKAFTDLRRRRADVADDAALAQLLEAVGADEFLAPPTRPDAAGADAAPTDAGDADGLGADEAHAGSDEPEHD